jgi:hypothetical protein
MPNFNYSQGLLNAAGNYPGVESKKPAAGLFAEYGILSPSEKRQQEMHAQLAQQAIMMQHAAQQQQMQLALAGAKANTPTGLGFSQFLAMGGANNIRNAEKMAGGMPAMQGMQGNAPGSMRTPPFNPNAPEADPNGIAWRVVNDAFQKFPDNRAMALKVAGTQLNALAQQRGDGDLASIAANLIQGAAKAEQEQVDTESKKASTKKTEFETRQQRRGTPFHYYSPDGKQVTETPFYDEQGNYIGDREEGRGVPAQRIKTEQPEDTQELNKEFRTFVESKDAANSRMNELIKGLDSGAAQGWGATIVNFMNNATGTLGQFVPNMDSGAMSALASLETTKFKEWAKKTGVQTAVWRDLISIQAKSYNPTGTITEKDVRQAAESVGGSFSDPATVKAILQNARRLNVSDVDNKWRYLPDKQREQAGQQYNTFKGRWGRQVKRSGTVKSGPNAGKKVTEYDDGTKEYK